MGYRIWLNTANKNDLKEYLKKEKQDYFDYHHNNDTQSIELSDGIQLDKLCKPVRKYRKDEYPPYILKEKEFIKILNFYRGEQYQFAIERIKKCSDKNKDIDSVRNSFRTFAISSMNYFNGSFKKKDDIYIADSNYFMFQYFYLVELYREFDFNNNVFLITHG